MDYRDWVREGEAELAKLPAPTPEEDAEIERMLAEEQAGQAAREEQAQAEADAAEEAFWAKHLGADELTVEEV
jgi:hypothetical protein